MLAMDVNDNAYLLDKRGAYVGASLLAMVVNDNACLQVKRGALESIASKLAPTKVGFESKVDGLSVDHRQPIERPRTRSAVSRQLFLAFPTMQRHFAQHFSEIRRLVAPVFRLGPQTAW